MVARIFWTKEELQRLKELCKKCSSLLELRTASASVFPNRSWDSVRWQVSFGKHADWVSHFRHGQAVASDNESSLRAEVSDMPSEDLEEKLNHILAILREKGYSTITAISEDPFVNVPKESVWPLIDALRERGHDIVEEKRKVFLKRSWPTVERSLPPITKRNRIEALFMQGPQLGLKTQQGDLLATCLEIGEQRGVFFAVMLGNLVAGTTGKAKRGEYFLTSVDEQADYVVSRYPKVSFNTYLLNGPAELSFRRGKEPEYIEALICSAREDIRYLGDEKAIIPVGRENAKVAVVATQGQAYTKSYPLQGIAENFQEAVKYIYEHSEPFRSLIVGGLDSGILIPRQLPIHPARYNDFDMTAIPTLHRITASGVVNKRRGASPVLGCLVLGANFADNGDFNGFTYVFYDLTAYFKQTDYLEDFETDPSLAAEAQQVLLRLKKGPARRGDLSRLIGRAIKTNGDKSAEREMYTNGTATVLDVLEELKNSGYVIEFDEARKAYVLSRRLRREFKAIDINEITKTNIRFLLTSDWHVGHYGERPDLIQKVFEIAEKHEVDLITCSGNVFEGYTSYDAQTLDLEQHGADAQRKRLFDIMPKSDIPLVLIGSPIREHDRVFWAKVGHDIVDTFTEIAKLRGYKVEYLGGPHGVFTLKGVSFDMQHPKGGLPYGQTYRIQRRLETLVSYLDLASGAKASFIGHLHRAAFMLYKGMAGFLVPCLKDSPEDEYITALDKIAELGVWVVEMSFDEFKNLIKVELEYIPFEPRSELIRNLNMDEVLVKFASNNSV